MKLSLYVKTLRVFFKKKYGSMMFQVEKNILVQLGVVEKGLMPWRAKLDARKLTTKKPNAIFI